MAWEQDEVTWAFRLFLKLLREGEIPADEREFHFAYQRTGVRDVLEHVIEPEADVKIFSTESALYLSPGISNQYFGYSNEELRKQLNLKNNQELYLAYFVLLCLFAKFYNSEDQQGSSRQFVSIEELEKTVTDHITSIREAEEEDLAHIEESEGIHLRSAAELWLEIPSFDDRVKNLKRAINNRVSFILRVLGFMEKEGLLHVLEEREIRLLPKCHYLITHYYFNRQRKENLLQLLSQPLTFKKEDSR
ncbi:DUF6063 family protein [Kroppenstedtia eburnea]|uniref:Uncharacterized protein n=1 Tax=Kroppenstedtia eburnea TaxID=714067 RepID=A0A1N7LLZ4_9BACL|nr:DUF6063 family protein [Kroppenstedtia eburnea]QKI81266.1 hypothetical protein GXN75_04225 [Kroppenstedtia eburnea]SIS74812.1 hypothetical protein SAMN05421790_104257 [Kroppenstedtia eburnea]